MLQAIRLTELGGRGRPRVRARCVLRVGMSSAFWNAPAASNRPAAAACSSQASVHEAQIQVDRIIYIPPKMFAAKTDIPCMYSIYSLRAGRAAPLAKENFNRR